MTLRIAGKLFLFLNSVLSILSVNELLWWRVETFVFGGADASVSTEERYILNTYLAALCMKIWESNQFGYAEKFAVLLQLDDDDLQQLIVEENHGDKRNVITTVKKYTKKMFP